MPYVVEAAHAAGKDLRVWPDPVPLAQQVAWPPEEAPLLQALRPLHAIALAWHDDGTWWLPEGRYGEGELPLLFSLLARKPAK